MSKLSKLKYVTIGLIIGITISTISVSIGATTTLQKFTLTKTNLKTKIAGKTYTDTTKNPILKLNSTTYIPLTTAIADAINVDISTDTKTQTMSIAPEKLQVVTKEIVYTEKNRIGYATVEDVEYISLTDVSKHYNLPFDIENNVASIYKSKADQFNNRPLKTNIPHSKLKDDTYITTDFYDNSLYPIIKINSPVAIEEEQAKIKTPDGLQVIIIDNISCVRLTDIQGKYYYAERSKKTNRYNIDTVPNPDKVNLYRLDKTPEGLDSKVLLLSNIPFLEKKDELNNKSYFITFEYYISVIMPLFI